MKLLKRVIALSLCLLMFVSDPFSALAQNDGTVNTVSGSDVQVCTECGLAEGHAEDCSYNPSIVAEITYPSKTFTDSNATYDVKSSDNYYTGAAVDTTLDTIDAGDQFKLTLTWDRSDFEPGQTYTYTTPAGFVLYTSNYSANSYSGGTVQDDYGNKNGSFSFSYDPTSKTSTVTITFDSSYSDSASGKLELYGKFDNPEDADPDGDGYISVPGDGKYLIYKAPAPEQSYKVHVKKYGDRKDSTGNTTFHYYIQVTASDGDLTNVVVTDTPDQNMNILTDTVYGSSTGYATSGDSLQTTVGKDIYEEKTTYSWTIPKIKSGESYYIHYDAEITNKSKASFENDVVATAGDKSDYASCTVSLKRPIISKSGTMNTSGNTVTWKISVTFNDFDSITLSENNGDTATIMGQSQNANATYTITYQPSGRKVTGNYADLYNDEFILTREGTETSAEVTFDMILPPTWGDTHTDVENTVWYYYGDTNGNTNASVPVSQAPRIQSKIGKDLASNHTPNNYTGGKPEIQWEVNLSFSDIPKNLYTVPRFADILLDTDQESKLAGQVAHQYIQDSFVLVYNGVEYNSSDWSQYIERLRFLTTVDGYNRDSDEDWIYDAYWNTSNGFTSQWSGQQAFIIEFADTAPAGDYTLKYKTSYDPSKAEWTSGSVENAFFANNYEYKKTRVNILLNYIRKAAESYNNYYTANVTDADVTWYIAFEPMQEYDSLLYFMGDDDEPIIVKDTLPEGFTVKSVKLKNQSGSEEPVVEHTPDEWSNVQSPNLYYQLNGQQLVVTIGKGETFDGYGQLKYGTYLEIVTEYEDYENLVPGVKSETFNNTANITVNGTTYADVTASVTITPPALVTKSISYMRENAPRPQFTVEVNPNGQDLMKNSESITVRDVILPEANETTPKQTFLADTLKVYEGIGTSKTLVDASKYTVSVNSEKTEFTITGLEDESAYTIEYRTHVDVPYDHTDKFHLINWVYLDGVCRDMNGDKEVGATEYVYAEVDWHGLVQLPSAINNLTTEYPTVFVEKTDAVTGALLKGAVFTIYDESGTKVGTITSGGEDGLTSGYQLTQINHTYTMKETTAPEGYVLSEEVWKFGRYTNEPCPNDVENLNGQKMKVYEIKNSPERTEPETTSLTIKKVGGESDENFLMTVTDGEEFTMQVIVPANGEVTIDGLTVGKTYTVTEDMNWAWRYSGDKTGSCELKQEAAQNVVTITNTNPLVNWLSGDSYCENQWSTDGTSITQTKSSQE